MRTILILLMGMFLFLACEKKEEPKEVKEMHIPEGVPAQFTQNLPRPFFTDHRHLSEIYWKSWELLQQNIRNGTSRNGFVSSYLDEGVSGHIYQWDTCFMALFAMYGQPLFPAMQSLDNFYARQRADGWIARSYRESDGQPVAQPGEADPMIHPPLFAWVEWKYFLLTGDNSRFERILPVLDAYYNWIDKHCRGDLAAAGLYYNTPAGSRMENSPRNGINKGGWIDLSAQMALFAKYMMFITREVPSDSLTTVYQRRYRLLVSLINGKMWDEQSGFYYDISSQGKRISAKTTAAFWTLLPEVATFPQARTLGEHLQNAEEFHRTHLYPVLSADHPGYDPSGNDWRGGVWPPINYMIIKGLDIYPLREIAAAAALNHVENIYQVYKEYQPADNQIAPEERDGSYQTIWECYAPDAVQPATRRDGKYLSRQDFVGSSGLGPVALLLENVIGLQPSAPRDELYWNLRLREKHGVENYRFGDNQADIICENNQLPVKGADITIISNSPFNLIVSSQVGVKTFEVKAGENRFQIKL